MTLAITKACIDFNLLTKLDEFNYSDIIRAILAKQPDFDTNKWLGEFKKYMYFVIHTNQSFHVPSHKLDEVWHAIILDTKLYQEFNAAMSPNRFIHHKSVSEQFASDDIQISKAKLSKLAVETFGCDFTWDTNAAICWCDVS
jgi:hypothetical protein